MPQAYHQRESMSSYHHIPHDGSHIRSPNANYNEGYGYPSHYDYNPYLPDARHNHHVPMNPAGHGAPDPRPVSPYSRAAGYLAPRGNSPPEPPLSPTAGAEEPTVKKKRKRADANQLKILTEVYNRTPFPSTEERLDLAKRLDMTPRSVQIWCAST
jgi:homeobox protein YOX1/YHP1